MNERKVPEVRFRGFSGEWEKKELSNIATMKARIGWQGLTQKEFLSEGDYYLITGTDFNNGKIDFKNCHFIDQERYQQDINIQIKSEDVLITKDGTIGKVAYVSCFDKPATLNAGVFVIRGKTKEILNLYLYHYLAAPYLLKYANEQATGGTIKHLNQNVFVGFPIPISEHAEQAKIGDFFKNLDNLIAQNQKKYDKLVNIKKACLDKMFPKDGADAPEVRFQGFSGEWKRIKITDVAYVFIGLVTTMTKFYCNDGVLLIRNSDIKDNRFEFSESPIYLEEAFADANANRKQLFGDVVTVHTGDVGTSAVVTKSETGAIGFATINTRANQTIIKPDYLATFFNSDLHKNYAIKMSTGDGRSNYNLRDFNELIVPVTTLAEQTKIGTIFQTLDNLITLRKTELEKLKNIKKACLDKMFI